MSVDRLLELALGAARDAGVLLLDRFGGPVSGVESKSSATDMVSDADRAAERLVLDRISAERPDDGVVAEESGRAEGSPASSGWSTRSTAPPTICSLSVWAVSIACEDADGGVVAVVHDPCRGETFAAVRGRGATLNGRPVHTRSPRGLDRALVGTGFSYGPADRAFQATVLTHVLGEVRDIRRGGSAALDLAWVACGRLDGFYEWGIKHGTGRPGCCSSPRRADGRRCSTRAGGSNRAWSLRRRICMTRCAAW